MNNEVISKQYAILLFACAVWFALSGLAYSHQTEPAVVTVIVESEQVEITIRDAIEPMIAITRVDPKSNADAGRVNEIYQNLRYEEPEVLESIFRDNWEMISKQINIFAGDTRLELVLDTAIVPEIGDPKQLRFSTLTIKATLPADGTPVRLGWRTDFGPIGIHQLGGDGEGYTQILQGGQVSEPMSRAVPVKEAAATIFTRFIVAGFEHIVPKGTDHILFVLGLFLFSLRLRPILAQVTAFTLAHSVSLALSSLNIVSMPARIVEPLIAISIVYVAIENIFFARKDRVSFARVAVVFCFGLLHGLGFASVLNDVGLPAGQFVLGLIGFNIGVELGQLGVILIAFLLLGLPFGRKHWYRAGIVIPASAAIAAVGLWWTIERVLG
ncbi:HupE/UreJ family protein [Paracoccus sp. R86501]|uniref:HupE/UreJ family protein n=1 Tax=Paracoccus sp. R86501 TaxID=3101711 RepID=UPI00366C2759